MSVCGSVVFMRLPVFVIPVVWVSSLIGMWLICRWWFQRLQRIDNELAQRVCFTLHCNNTELMERWEEEVERQKTSTTRAAGQSESEVDDTPLLAQWRWVHWAVVVDGKTEMAYELCLVECRYVGKEEGTMEVRVVEGARQQSSAQAPQSIVA